jgi:hypothetical protein
MNRSIAITVAAILLSVGRAQAADHAVRPVSDCSFDGDGTAWSCAASTGAAGARRGFPASGTLARGDTYYVADGTYGAVDIRQDAQGTAWITLRKAVAGAHGPAAGWTTALGDGQAVFSNIMVRASDHGADGGYIEIDGATGSGKSGYGFVITSADDESELFIVPYYYMGKGGHVTLRHAELYHQTYVPDRGAGSIKIGEGSGNFTFQDLYIHDIPCNGFTLEGVTDVLVDGCTIVKNHSTASWHGQALQADGGSRFVISNNWWEDITGTAYIAMLSGSASDWKVYNNVFYQTASAPEIAHGPFSTNSSASTLSGLRFFSNTIVNFRKGLSARVYLPGTVTDAQIRNNLWYCSGTGCLAADHTTGSGIALSNNWYSPTVSHPAGTGDAGNASDPFVGLTALNFRLAAGADPIDKGFALGPPFDLDMAGTTRPQGVGWDMGAFEYTTAPPNRESGGHDDFSPPRRDGAPASDLQLHGDRMRDASGDGARAASSSGCSCELPAAPVAPTTPLLLLAAGLLLARLRRR